MNAQTKIVKSETVEAKKPASSQPEKFDINDAHILRSKFLNRFSLIEAWAAKFAMKLNGSGQPNRALKQNIDKIWDSKTNNKDKITKLLDELCPYIEFRGEMAHSEIECGYIGSKQMIFYKNAVDGVHFTLKKTGYTSKEDLVLLTNHVHSISARLINLTK